VETTRSPDPIADVPDESGTPTAAIDLPGPIGSLHDLERDRAGPDCRAAALTAGLPSAPVRHRPRRRAGRTRQRPRPVSAGLPRSEGRDSANADPLAQADLAVAAVTRAVGAAAVCARLDPHADATSRQAKMQRRMQPGATSCLLDARARGRAPRHPARQVHLFIGHDKALAAASTAPLGPASRRRPHLPR
jgi:hypothetical protein